MRGPGSIRGWLLVPAAFVVLVTLRFVSLVLGNTKPEITRTRKRKVTYMAHVKSILSITAEAAWALGTSVLAGLPLLTWANDRTCPRHESASGQAHVVSTMPKLPSVIEVHPPSTRDRPTRNVDAVQG